MIRGRGTETEGTRWAGDLGPGLAPTARCPSLETPPHPSVPGANGFVPFPREAFPPLYRLFRVLGRVAARAYFHRVEIVHAERVPPEGPLILAANHPQSITDAWILAVASPRPIHFVAHSGLFSGPLRGALLRAAGMIPIHRPEDVTDAAARNEQAFAQACAVLHDNRCLGIFPEGTSQQQRRLQPLKTGTARIALEAERQGDFRLGVRIVPVGLSFQSRRRFRSRVLVLFGEPLVVADHRERFEEDPQAAARELTARLEEAIRHRVVDVRRSELEGFVRRAERVYKAELAERPELEIPGIGRFERDQYLARAIARATDWFYEHQPERLWGIGEMLERYERERQTLGLPDRLVREEGPGFARAATSLALRGLLGLPLAAWGLLTNYLPYRITVWSTRSLGPDATKTHPTQMAIGTVVFGSFYGAYLLWAQPRWGTGPTLALAISLPLSGLFARLYLVTLRRRRRYLHYAYLRSAHGLLLQKLRSLRTEIVAAMDEALEDYLARPEASGGETARAAGERET